MISSLMHKPTAHTVAEWIFATLVPPLYTVAQETGLLEEVAKGNTHPDVLAARLGLSKRGVLSVLRCLQAAEILRKINNDYYEIHPEALRTFQDIVNSVNALAYSVNNKVFDMVDENGILPGNAPRELLQLGITEAVGPQQILTVPGRRYFTPGQDYYVGSYVNYACELLGYVGSHLTQAVKTGKPALEASNNTAFFAPMASALFCMHYEIAQQLADHVSTFEDVNTLLEIGAGSSVWSIPLAKKKPQLQIDALDLPPVLNITKAFTQQYGVGSQYCFLPGNWSILEDWEPRSYDLIYMNYFGHNFSVRELQCLFTACEKHLRPGGYLVAAGFIAQPDWTSPLRDVLFSALALCISDYGDARLPTDYETWCHNAGLRQLEWITVPASIVPIPMAHKTRS